MIQQSRLRGISVLGTLSMTRTDQGRRDVPQPPDPYALHEATLAKLQQQAAAERSSSASTSTSASRSASSSASVGIVATTRFRRGRAESRADARDGPTTVFGATNFLGAASGALYDLAAVVLSLGMFFGKWALIGGTKLFSGMFKAASWVLHEITGGD